MVLIIGGTGTVGRALTEELGAAGVPARALVRGPAGAAQVAAAGLDPVVGSLEDEEAVRGALDGVQRLFLLTPPGVEEMVEAQTRVVDQARDAGVRHVVKLSSIGADEAPTGAAIIDAHRAVEEHVIASGMRWTFLRPNWFMQNELGQVASVAGDGVLHAPDVTRITAVDARDVAAAAAAVLTGDGHAGRAYTLTGPVALDYADVATAFGRLLGRAVRWQEVTLDEARESMLGAGLPPVLAGGFTEIMARYRRGGVTAEVSPAVQELTGRAPRSFEQFLRDHAPAFRDALRAAA